MATVDEKLSKIRNNIRTKFNNREYYEAHQLYKVLHFRFGSQKKYKEALELMMEGSLALFEVNQMSSAVDLALLFIDLLEKSNAVADSENITKVSRLHRLIATDHIEKQKFVAAAMQWVHKCGPTTMPNGTMQPSSSMASSSSGACNSTPNNTPTKGSTLLHGEFGINYWLAKDYAQARYHLVRSREGEACASMLIEYHVTCGYPNEVDLFIAQAVFQLLCLSDKKIAATCFNCYTSKHPQVEAGPPYIKPLFNFLWMLLIAIDKKSLNIFTVLCEQYDFSLRQDPSYHDYLAKIAHIFFNVNLPKKNNYGIFGNLMPEMLRGDEDRMEPSPVDLD